MSLINHLVCIVVVLLVTNLQLLTALKCPTGGKPRVRREWRSLSSQMRERVVTAMWTMKNLTTEESRKMYGRNFINADDLLVQHACAVLDPRCDQGHSSPAFMTSHRVILLRHELSLLSIDPDIEAMPYWDVSLDSESGIYFNDTSADSKYIFSSNFFGSYQGNPNKANIVSDGVFADWPVATYAPERFGPSSPVSAKCLGEGWFKETNATKCKRCCFAKLEDNCVCNRSTDAFESFLRTHDFCAPAVARDPFGQVPFDGTFYMRNTRVEFDACTNVTNIKSWTDWMNCIEPGYIDCADPGGAINFWEVPSSNVNARLATLGRIATDRGKGCSLTGYYIDSGTGKEVRVYGLHTQAHLHLGLDLLDVSTSPNDVGPFFGDHSNIDRSHMTWMLKSNYLSPDLWGFPVDQTVPDDTLAGASGPYPFTGITNFYLVEGMYPDYKLMDLPWYEGTLADDIASAGHPFSHLFGEQCDSGPYTHADIVRLSAPEKTTYTYNTLEHFYDDCELPDPPKCDA